MPTSTPQWSKTPEGKAYHKRHRTAQAARRVAWVKAYKVAKGCVDCGYNAHPEALDFDHVAGVKVGNISRMTTKVGMDRLMAEIAKCEVVCANCHRVRTSSRR